MSFNLSKSSVHIGLKNNNFTYFLGNNPISSNGKVKDLGVIVDQKLKFHLQSAAAAKKAISSANYVYLNLSVT